MAELLARIEELLEIAKMENPTTPEWYLRACVEDYITREEPELAKLKDELPKEELKNKPEEKHLPNITEVEEIQNETD